MNTQVLDRDQMKLLTDRFSTLSPDNLKDIIENLPLNQKIELFHLLLQESEMQQTVTDELKNKNGREDAPTYLGKDQSFFDEPQSLEELAQQQGVKPVTNLDDLVADFWPKDESVDDFISAVRQWRREGTTREKFD